VIRSSIFARNVVRRAMSPSRTDPLGLLCKNPTRRKESARDSQVRAGGFIFRERGRFRLSERLPGSGMPDGKPA
jgi:hypothetical protein